MSTAPEPDPSPGQQAVGSRGSDACCFCWCCCCSCSWGSPGTSTKPAAPGVLQACAPRRGRSAETPRRVTTNLTVRNQAGQRPRTASQELGAEEHPACEDSPSPTLEEVRAWGQSFEQLMLTPAGRNAFREFLRTEFSEENMLFWMACEELKREANHSAIEEKARTIYEDYISILSPKEVSLDSRVREVINRDMEAPSQHVFDDAQLQIYTLMHRDSYPRFMSSALYRDLLQSLADKAVEA